MKQSKNTMKKNINYTLLGIGMLASVSFLSCHNKNGDTNEIANRDETDAVAPAEIVITKEQFKSSGMKIGEPIPMRFEVVIHANGYVVASPSGLVKISTLIPGRVKQVNRSVGDYIKKGEVLFILESNEIISLQQEYGEAFNQLKSLKANYERQKALSEEQITAEKDFINAESDYRSLLMKTEGLKARLKMINIDPAAVEKGTIVPIVTVHSPIQGFIAKQDLVLGQFIEPQATVMELINPDQLQLNIHVFEKDLQGMIVGQPVRYYAPDNRDQVFQATLSHIGRSIDPDSKTVLCIAHIKAPEQRALVNRLFVETEIVTCEREAPAIPSQALTREENRYYALQLVNEEGENLIFRKIPVNVGVVRHEFTEVLDEGLKDILMEGAYDVIPME